MSGHLDLDGLRTRVACAVAYDISRIGKWFVLIKRIFVEISDNGYVVIKNIIGKLEKKLVHQRKSVFILTSTPTLLIK
ncbi:hypothetical protein KIN20_013054 [Parelaphostrongylus tenuis]|uniref:Uncharacterized protein n=1 Tax=Parelaphostrongylus tenuis TaxID=148309 RepID=A0AAD5MWZ0_PARTN|nr:hypothetical protein KIN20_013054 [Parelaphostrongylus tenuis]